MRRATRSRVAARALASGGADIVGTSSSGNFLLLAVLGMIVVIAFATAAFVYAARTTVSGGGSGGSGLFFGGGATSSLLMPSQEWNLFGRTAPTTPPLQDHLDRLLPSPAADALLAPSGLARLRALGGGTDVPIPMYVRPPIDKTYKQVGTLVRQRGDGSDVSDADLDILPLMGQWLHGDKWRYFTMTGGAGNKLPVEREGSGGCGSSSSSSGIGVRRKCTGEYGCNELSNDEVLVVPGFKDKFVTHLYDNGTFFS